jgi:hypothetical protein
MIALRFGLDDIGTGGGAPRFGAESEETAAGRVEGTGGGDGALLLNPISNADRRGGGGAIALLVREVSFEDCLCGNAGTGRGDCSRVMDCLGGREGLAGRLGVFSLGGSA